MSLEHIKELLSINGFRPINTNLEEVTLYDKSAGDRSYLLVLCDFSGYRRLDADQLRHILWRISMNENFVVRGREMLALLVTEDAAYGRSLLQAGFPVWILDCRENSLRIYEDQPADFAGLKAQLENLLGEKGHWRARRSSQFTLCNTILIAINVIMFLSMNLFDKGTSGNRMIRWGAMYTPYMEHPQELYRLITAMFLHFDVSHLTSNMVILVALGDNLERVLGRWQYVFLYFLSGLGAGLASCAYNVVMDRTVVSAGASGAVFGVIGGLFFLVIKNKGKLEELTAPRLALMIVYILYSGFTTPGIDNAAHVGGLLTGMAAAFLLYLSGKTKIS